MVGFTGVAARFHHSFVIYKTKSEMFFPPFFYVHCHVVELFILVSPGCTTCIMGNSNVPTSSKSPVLIGSNFSLALQNNKKKRILPNCVILKHKLVSMVINVVTQCTTSLTEA